jgi:hypothetical protein
LGRLLVDKRQRFDGTANWAHDLTAEFDEPIGDERRNERLVVDDKDTR